MPRITKAQAVTGDRPSSSNTTNPASSFTPNKKKKKIDATASWDNLSNLRKTQTSWDNSRLDDRAPAGLGGGVGVKIAERQAETEKPTDSQRLALQRQIARTYKKEDDSYAQKYYGSSKSKIDTAMKTLKDDKTERGQYEYNWLKSNQYYYWTTDQLKRGIKDAEKKSQSSKQAARNQKSGWTDASLTQAQQAEQLMAQRDKAKATSETDTEIEAMRRALSDKVYGEELSKLNEKEMATLLDYGKAENAMADVAESTSLVPKDTKAHQDAQKKAKTMLEKKGYSPEEVEALLDYSVRAYNQQEALRRQKEISEKSVGGKIAASAASVPMNLAGGPVGYLDALLQKATAKTDPFTGQKQSIDYNSRGQMLSNMASDIRGGVSKDMNGFWSFIYNTGMSIADFASVAPLGGVAAEALLGASAAQNAMQDAHRRGASDDQALAIGLTSGLAEAVFEHLSLERLDMFKTAAQGSRLTKGEILEAIGMQGFTEGSEEAATNLANTMTDLLIMADKSQIEQTKQAYMAQGMSKAEATRQAWKEAANQLLLDAAGGFLSGGVIGSAGAVGAHVNYTLSDARTGVELLGTYGAAAKQDVEAGLLYPKASQTYKQAAEMVKKQAAGKELTSREIGRLHNLMQSDRALGYQPNQNKGGVGRVEYEYNPMLEREMPKFVTGPITDGFLQAGLNAHDAINRATILQDMLDGEEVPGRKMKDQLKIFSPETKQVFAELTGAQVPEGLSPSATIEFYRNAITEYRDRQDAAAREQLRQAEEAAQQQAEAEALHAESAQEAETILNDAIEEVQSEPETADTTVAPETQPEAPIETYDAFVERVQNEYRAKGQRERNDKQMEELWEYETQQNGIRMDDGSMISWSEFAAEWPEYYKSQNHNTPTKEDLLDEYQLLRAGSRNNPMPRAWWDASITGKAPAEEAPVEEEPRAEVLSVEAPVEEAPAEEAPKEADAAREKFSVAGKYGALASDGKKISYSMRATVEMMKKLFAPLGVVDIHFDGENLGPGKNASIQRTKDGIVIRLNETNLGSAELIYWGIGHELTHPSSESDPELAKEIVKTLSDLAKAGAFDGELATLIVDELKDPEAAIQRRVNDYTETYLRDGYSDAEIQELTTDDEMRVEVAGDWMGYVFTSLPVLERIAGVKPDLLTRAIRAVNRFRGTEVNQLVKNGKRYKETVKTLDDLVDRMRTALANSETGSPDSDKTERYSLHKGPAWKKMQYGFKLMDVDEEGKPHAMFIDAGKPYELGVAYDADSPQMKDLAKLEPGYAYQVDSEGNADQTTRRKVSKRKGGTFAGLPGTKLISEATDNDSRWIVVDTYSNGDKSFYNVGINGSGSPYTYAMRPGIHAVDIPSMRHIGSKTKGSPKIDTRRPDQRWFLIEYPVDEDYNQEAYNNTSKDIPDHLPTNGWYSYQTNSGAEAKQHWFITGGMRIVGPVSEADVRKYARDRGFAEDLPWKDGKAYDESDSIDLDKYMRTTKAQPTPSKDEMRRRIERERMSNNPALAFTEPHITGRGSIDAEPKSQYNITNEQSDEGGEKNGRLEAETAEGLREFDRGRGNGSNQAGVPGVRGGRGAEVGALQEEPGQLPEQSRGDQESGGQSSELPRLVLLSQSTANKISKSKVALVDVADAPTNYVAFSSYLDAARESDPDHGWAVTPQSAEELAKKNGVTIMAKDGGSGVFVTPDGDIEGVFRNKITAPKGALRTLMPLAIENGGRKLDCYGEDLVSQYVKHGFVPVAKTKFNPKFANPGWTPDKGRPDIYFMMYTGPASADAAVDGYGKYPAIDPQQLESFPYMEYDKAMAHRDELLAEAMRGGDSIRYSATKPVTGLYNLSERVISDMKQNKFGASSVVNMLRGKGVKAEEIKWLDIESFLAGKKSVTKDELLDYIRANDLQIEEETLTGEDTTPEEWEYAGTGRIADYENPDVFYDSIEEAYDASYDQFVNEYGWGPEETERALRISGGHLLWDDPISGRVYTLAGPELTHRPDATKPDETRWGKYTTPGGTNYREVLFRLPGSDYSNAASGGHWGDKAPGVFAHARVQDFDSTDGQMLFVDEIQSDWHNEGQREGYWTKEDSARREAWLEWDRRRDEVIKSLSQLLNNNSFHSAIRKLAVVGFDTRHIDSMVKSGDVAVEKLLDDYDTVSGIWNQNEWGAEAKPLTTDEEKAVREYWAMREQKEKMGEDEPDQPIGRETNPPDAPFKDNYTDFVLKSLLREAAENGYDGVAWTTAQMQSDRWSDEYMEGYRIEYDQDIPKFLNKFGKKFGAKVGTTSLIRDDGTGQTIEVPFIPITKEMRKSVVTDGLPKFSVRGNSPAFDAYIDKLMAEQRQRLLQEHPSTERQSQTRSTTPMLTPNEKRRSGFRAKDRTHTEVTDAMMADMVAARLENDFEGEKQRLYGSSDKWDASDLAVAEEILKQTIEEARKTGDYSEARRLIRAHDSQMSDWGLAGHTAQNFGHSFASIVTDATNILDEAADHEGFNKEKKKQAQKIEEAVGKAGKDARDVLAREIEEAASEGSGAGSNARTGRDANGRPVIQDKQTTERNRRERGNRRAKQQQTEDEGLNGRNMVGEPFTFELPEVVGEAIGKTVANRVNQTEKAKTYLQEMQAHIMRYVTEKLPKRKTKVPATPTELLREYIQNREFYERAWAEAQNEVRRQLAAKGFEEIPPELEEFLGGWYGVDANGNPQNKILRAAIAHSALTTEETADKIRRQAALGVRSISDIIANDLIKQTGAKGEIAETIRSAAQFYVDDVLAKPVRGKNGMVEFDLSKQTEYLDRMVTSALQEIGRAIDKKTGPSSMQRLGATSAAYKNVIRNTVIDTLMRKYGVSTADAQRVAKIVGDRFDTLLKRGMDERLESLFKEKVKPDRTKQQTFVNRVVELTNLGALDSKAYHDAAVNLLLDGYKTRRGGSVDKVLSEIYDYARRLEDIPEGDITRLKKLVSDLNAKRWTGGMIKGDQIHRTLQKAIDFLAAQTDGDTFLRKLAAAQIRGIANDNAKLTVVEALSAERYMAMLSKLTTTMRNLVGNTMFDLTESNSQNLSVLFDWLLALRTGQRTTTFDLSYFSDAKRKGMVDGMLRAYVEVALDAPIEDLQNRWEMRGGRTFKMAKPEETTALNAVPNAAERFLSSVEKWQRYLLTVSDEMYKGGIRAERQRQIDKLKAKGKLAPDALQNEAQQVALERTFQNRDKMATAVGNIRSAFDIIGVKDYKGTKIGAGTAAMPFAVVPANIVGQIFNYSPAGLVKALVEVADVAAKGKDATPEQQSKAIRDLGRGMNGSGLIGLLVLLVAKGIIKGVNSDDDDEKALLRDEGRTGIQLNLSALKRWAKGESTEWEDDDNLMNIGGIEPLNGPMAFATLVADAADQEGAWWAKIANANVQTAFKSLGELPAMSTVNNVVNAYKYSDEKYDQETNPNGGAAKQAADAAATFASDFLSSGVPNVLSGIAAGMDEGKVRTTKTSDKRGLAAIPEETLNAMKLKIPGLRQKLPQALDSFGQERQTTATKTQNWLNSNVLPLTLNKYKPNEVSEELMRLDKEVGITLPKRNAAKTLDTSDGKKKLTESERRKYQQTTGGSELKTMTDALKSSDYKSMNDETRAKVWANLASFANRQGQIAVGVKSPTAELPSNLKWSEKYSGSTADKAIKAAWMSKAKADAKLDDNPSNLDLLQAVTKASVPAAMKDELLKANLEGEGWTKYSGAKAIGLSADTYLKILIDTTQEKMPAEKNAKGVTISGSRKAKVVAYLDALVESKAIKPEQRDYIIHEVYGWK